MGCVSCKRPVPASESIDLHAAGHQLEAGPTFYVFLWNPHEIPKRAPLGQGIVSWTPNPTKGSLEHAKEGVLCTCHNLLYNCSLSHNLHATQIQKEKPSPGLEF